MARSVAEQVFETYQADISVAASHPDLHGAKEIVVLGPAGSNSHVVAEDITARQNRGQEGLRTTFKSAFSEIVDASRQNGGIGLLPVVNQIGGMVMHNTAKYDSSPPKSNYQVIEETGSRVLAYVGLPIEHCLLGLEGLDVTQLRGMEVHSHIQALKQCANYIEAMGLVPVEALSTSAAAEMLSQNREQKTKLAIAPALAGKIYNLQPLAKDVGNTPAAQNITTMALVTVPNLRVVS